MSAAEENNLIRQLENSFGENAAAAALEFADRSYTYRELDEVSAKIASYLLHEYTNDQLVGIWAEKSFFTYAAIVGIIRAGKAYVPLNPKFPSARNNEIIDEAQLKVILHPGNKLPDAFIDKKGIVLLSESIAGNSFDKPNVRRKNAEPAYLLFTSGSGGKPKGVLISLGQLSCYLENIDGWTEMYPGAKCSQTFDLTFDLSVHDIFYTFCGGGTLCIPAEKDLLSPATYIKSRSLTHWFSVPSYGVMMDKLRQLKENNFPRLQFALFCGEALSVQLAKKFMSAAPGAQLLNLYGPTEATIAISAYYIGEDLLEKNNNVCIGRIFDNNDFAIEEEPGYTGLAKGELLLCGDQVITNYFNRQEPDEKYFLREEVTWYRTGDIVELDEENNLYYLGRKDTQVKLNGYRVELGEIEATVKTIADERNAVCFVKEENNSGYLVCVLEGEKTVENVPLLEALRQKLPSYMLPQQIVYLHSFPLNPNGKVDRNEVIKIASA
jgi:amino acid adenylation domain-containing protein